MLFDQGYNITLILSISISHFSPPRRYHLSLFDSISLSLTFLRHLLSRLFALEAIWSLSHSLDLALLNRSIWPYSASLACFLTRFGQSWPYSPLASISHFLMVYFPLLGLTSFDQLLSWSYLSQPFALSIRLTSRLILRQQRLRFCWQKIFLPMQN
ncbi:hypothetical protein PanWU01x14_013430 [Parasponia andersonii]|uniref:Uncharacterized protein n=1 Tax=Parasponia andersonii TaxID=3476 RepID=A0A2P5E135_PARAD|nr:hypothetical protein PanWU01x14_013430 [Parasponia andersonii]